MFYFVPGGHDDVMTIAVPELQRRALFRTDHHGPMLRDPANRLFAR